MQLHAKGCALDPYPKQMLVMGRIYVMSQSKQASWFYQVVTLQSTVGIPCIVLGMSLENEHK